MFKQISKINRLAIIALLLVPVKVSAEWIPYDTSNSPLQTNNISSLTVSPDNRLLIGSHGAGLFVKYGNDWSIFNEDNTGVPINYANSIRFDNDTMFVGSASGDLDSQPLGEGLSILHIADSTWSELNSGLEINHIITGIEIAPGYRAVSTYGGGITIFNDVGWIRYQAEFRTEFTYADSQQQTFEVEPGTYLLTDYLLGLDYDTLNDILWIATLGGGVVAFSNNTWQTYNTENSGLPSNRIQVIKVGPCNTKVYFGTYGYGLVQKDGDNWTTYNTDNSPLVSDYIYSLEIRPDNSDLWIGTNIGLSVLTTDDLWHEYIPPDSNLVWGDFYSDIAFDSSGNVWVATFGGGMAKKSLEEGPEPEDTLSVCVNKLKFFLRKPPRNDITWLKARIEPLVMLEDEDSVSITVDSELGRIYSWEYCFDQFWHIFHWHNIDLYMACVNGSIVLLKYKHNQGRIKISLLDWNQQINEDNFAPEVDVRIKLDNYVGFDHVNLWPGDPAQDPDTDTLYYDEDDLLYSNEFDAPTIIEDNNDFLPENADIPVNHPNPFNASTKILFTTSRQTMVRFTVYDVLGRVVSVDENYFNAGAHSLNWNGSTQASGVYYYTLQIGDKGYTGKMTLLK